MSISIQEEFCKAEEVLKHLNGKEYRFKPIPKAKHSPLIFRKDIHLVFFVAFMIASFVLTDCLCQSIFGE